MASLLTLLLRTALGVIIDRLPAFIQDMQKRQAAAKATEKLAADQARIADFVSKAQDHVESSDAPIQ